MTNRKANEPGMRPWHKMYTSLLAVVACTILPCAASNLVTNGSFESYTGEITSNAGKWQYLTAVLSLDGWTKSGGSGNAGLSTASDTVWHAGGSIDGNIVLFFLQSYGLSQSINVTDGGRYRVQFKYAARSSATANGLIRVEIDGMEVGCVDSEASSTFRFALMETELAAGTHTLVIYHDNSQQDNACSAIDALSVFKAEEGNLVANGSFEDITGAISDHDGKWQYLYNNRSPSLDVWTISGSGNVGLSTASDTVWHAGGSIDGNIVCFFQQSYSLSQPIKVATGGRYRIEFKYAARNGTTANGRIRVEIDGSEVGYADCGDSQAFRLARMNVELDAGIHTLVIRHDNSQQDNACSSIDAFSVKAHPARGFIVSVF